MVSLCYMFSLPDFFRLLILAINMRLELQLQTFVVSWVIQIPLYRISEWNYQVFTVLLSLSTPRLSVKLWQAIVKSFFIHLLQLRQGRNLLWTSVWEKMCDFDPVLSII